MNIDSIMKELSEYIRMGEQIAATVGGGTMYIVLFFILLPFMVLSECVKKNK